MRSAYKDVADPGHVAEVAETILHLSERLPEVVDELEREPTLPRIRALYTVRNALQSLFLELGEAPTDGFAPGQKT